MAAPPPGSGPPPIPYPFDEPDRLVLDPGYEKLRTAEGLTRVQLPYGTPAWLATRYADVKAMLADPRFSRSEAVGQDEPRVMSYVHRPDSLTTMDPPGHTRLRRVVSKAFAPRRIESLRPRTQEVVDARLDALEAAGPPADLMHGLALPTSMTVVCEMLGIAYEDRDHFHEWSEVLASTASSRFTPEQLQEANADLRAYLAEQVARRRADQGSDDLLGALVEARDTEDRLSEDEMVGLAWSVLLAGYEITAHEIGNFVYTLLTHPETFARLRSDPGLVPRAVEELLRFVPLTTAAFYPRRATEDVELGGTLVRAGEAVLPSMLSANLDPAAFPDADVLDIDRPDDPHLAFSHGLHHCLGAQLARMELQVVVGALARRLPALALAVPLEEVPWRSGSMLRGPLELMVTW